MARINTGHLGSKTKTAQSAPIPGREGEMVKNAAGGYVFGADAWKRLNRFLMIGVEGGTYYISERKLTQDNAKSLNGLIKADGPRVVELIREVARDGRAAKREPQVYALAACAALGDDETRDLAYAALEDVARIPTNLFGFNQYFLDIKGSHTMGRKHRRAMARWYNEKDPERLAFLMSKYQSREGWSHKDMISMAHVSPAGEEHANLFAWAFNGPEAEGNDRGASLTGDYMRTIKAFEWAKKASSTEEITQLITEYGLSWEHVPTQFLKDPEVWRSLIPNLGYQALMRNLNKMPLDALSHTTEAVCEQLTDQEKISKSRIHPFNILIGLKTYAEGRGFRGSKTWNVNADVVDALDKAFYVSFGNLEKTGKRMLLLVDVSGSMRSRINGSPLSCAQAAGAISLVLKAQEGAGAHIYGFADGRGSVKVPYASRGRRFYLNSVQECSLIDLGISPRTRLDSAFKAVQRSNFGGTDASAGVCFALQAGLDVDQFVVLTDNETWCGPQHVTQALTEYRRKMGKPNAGLISCAFAANSYSVADPKDPRQMDVCGLDGSLPKLISDFALDRV